jgi:multiple sugar transport system permease protein
VLNLPFAIWMLQSFFADIPSELEEAAAIDGCNRMTTFLRIILPLARPGLFATAILTFIFSWKDFLFALTLTSTPAGMTIPVGIATFAQEYSVRYGEMAAAASLAIVPALVFVVFAQRHIVKGLTFGALKG